MLKKMKEIEYNMSSIYNVQSIPSVPALTVPIHIQQIYDKNMDNLSLYYELFEQEQHNELIQEVQCSVTSWTAEIHKVAKITGRNLTFEFLSYETVYWNKYKSIQNQLEENIKRPQIHLCLELLKRAKKFHITMGFFADSGLKEAFEFVQQKKTVLRDLPLDKFYSASNWKDLEGFISDLISQLTKKVKSLHVSAEFLIHLVDRLSEEFVSKVLSLSSGLVSQLNLKDILIEARNILFEWDYNVKAFQTQLREATRKRTTKFSSLKANVAYTSALNLVDKLADTIIEFALIAETFHRLKENTDFFNSELQCK